MPISSLHWRALALLGALLSVILMWPFCCAARPLPDAASSSQRPASVATTNTTMIMTSKASDFLKVVFNRTELDDSGSVTVRVSNRGSKNGSEVLSRSDRSAVAAAVGGNATRRGRRRESDRNERSANLSHITGANRKIQLYIKNRFLQILPDGSINGTHDDNSDYSEYCLFDPPYLCFCCSLCNTDGAGVCT